MQSGGNEKSPDYLRLRSNGPTYAVSFRVVACHSSSSTADRIYLASSTWRTVSLCMAMRLPTTF